MKSTTFNTQIIERRNTVTLGTTLNATGTFIKQIFINYIPDELRVVNISYSNAAVNEPGVFLLYSDIVQTISAFFRTKLPQMIQMFTFYYRNQSLEHTHFKLKM